MPKWVVGFDDWMGSTCQLYMASELGYLLPTKLIKATFHHGFNVLKRTHIFGVVNSLNSRAMRLDTWLGFTEVLRVAGAHEGGGDIVVFQMTPETCRWLERNQNGQKEVSHP
jgi:RimJ/RimL family protein N-acetyltransferase